MKKTRVLFVICILFAFIAAVSVVILQNRPSKQADSSKSGKYVHQELDEEVLSQIPINEVAEIVKKWQEKDPGEIVGFRSSMGCTDVTCADFTNHTHWCPRTCLDQSHGHSDEEYETAEKELLRKERAKQLGA